jgi:hypothetical protein
LKRENERRVEGERRKKKDQYMLTMMKELVEKYHVELNTSNSEGYFQTSVNDIRFHSFASPSNARSSQHNQILY